MKVDELIKDVQFSFKKILDKNEGKGSADLFEYFTEMFPDDEEYKNIKNKYRLETIHAVLRDLEEIRDGIEFLMIKEEDCKEA